MFSKEFLHKLFHYEDGRLYHKINHSNAKCGSEAKAKTSHGYKIVTINKKQYKVHRIIWAMHYDNLPKFLDHIDGNKDNNLISNLRPASRQQNQCNRKKPLNNTSSVKNVVYEKSRKKWKVQIKANKQNITVGRYDNLEAAELVAILAREKYHGIFANHNS
jgi:hypothetical protein